MLQRVRANGPPAIVYGACAVTLALGLFFIFVWTPLPWGWHGIDFYYENALALARGESFGTTKIMWGYAYFLAPWYYLFGDRPWIPLVAQAAINASVPLIVYHLARREIGERVAIVAAALAGILSFNTIYASTQAADAICTPIVAALVLAWGTALRRDGSWSGATRSPAALFAISGVLAGVAYQFRPNLVLFPLFLAALTLAVRRTAETLRYVSVFLGLCAAAGLPWVVHAYRSTGLLIPASTHGGRQLWFGTLQTGPFFDNWFANPRSVFGDAYLGTPAWTTSRSSSAATCSPARSPMLDRSNCGTGHRATRLSGLCQSRRIGTARSSCRSNRRRRRPPSRTTSSSGPSGRGGRST